MKRKISGRALSRKFMAAALILALAGGLVPAYALTEEDRQQATFHAYSDALSAMIQTHDREDYVAKIVFTRGVSGYEADGVTVEIGPEAVEDRDGTLLTSQRALASAVGGALTGGSTLVTPEGMVDLSQSGLSAQSTEQLVDPAQAARALGYTVTETEESVVLTRPFQTARLLVYAPGAALETGEAAACAHYNGWYVLQYDSEEAAKAACAQWQNTDGVSFAEPDQVYYGLDEEEIPSADETVSSGESTLTAQSVEHLSWGVAAMEADGFTDYLNALAQSKSESLPTVVVAVLDTGATLDHPFLEDRFLKDDNNQVVGKDFANNDDDPTDDAANTHGTHVCGIVADCTPENVKLMPVKVLKSDGSGTYAQLISAIEWAALKKTFLGLPMVLNMSLGGAGAMDQGVQTAINNARTTGGILSVVAAGNDKANLDTTPYCPASGNQVITVSALKKSSAGDTYTAGTDTLSFDDSYSNYGSAVEISAPGTAIYSSVNLKNQDGTIKLYDWKRGTSMATPHVSGAVALLLTAQSFRREDTDPGTIENLLTTQAVTDLGPAGKDVQYGYGALNLAGVYAPTLSNLAAGSLTYGQPLSVCTITGTAAYGSEPIEGTFSWQNGDEVPAVGTAQKTVGFTPGDSALYRSATGTVSVTVTPRVTDNLTVTLPYSEYFYTGSPLEPSVTVKDGENPLTAGTDYTVSYGNNTEVGQCTVTVTGLGNYAGSTGTAVFSIRNRGANDRILWIGAGFSVTYSSGTAGAETEDLAVVSTAAKDQTATFTAVGAGQTTGTVLLDNAVMEIYGVTVLEIGTVTDTGEQLYIPLEIPGNSGLASVFLAAYNQAGRLVGLQRVTIGADGFSGTVTVSTPDWFRVRVLGLGAGSVPLLSAVTILQEGE